MRAVIGTTFLLDRGITPIQRAAIWDNIQRFRDLLRREDVQDHHAADTVKELLSAEVAKLSEVQDEEEQELR